MVLGQYAGRLAQDKDARIVNAKPAIARAQAAGCKDPLLMYAYLDFKFYPSNTDATALAQMYTQMEQEMEHSGYSPLRKFSASSQAAQKVASVSKSTPAGKRSTTPEGIGGEMCLTHAREHLIELIHDNSVDADSAFAAASDFFWFIQDDPSSAANVMEPLALAFESKGPAAIKPTAANKLLEGMFWVGYAWQARTRQWANNVAPEGWQRFGERLPKAAAALEAAYALDPSNTFIAQTMLQVELGQGKGRVTMEKWFRRAMNADPDSYRACSSKLEYIKPKWYGSEDALLEFGHQCLATQNWKANLPYILMDVHNLLAEEAEDPAAYWKRPEVWKDVEPVCRGRMEADPNFPYRRTQYALYAYRAGQWKTADDLFKILGDKPDLRGLDTTKAQYDEMRRQAAAKAQ